MMLPHLCHVVTVERDELPRGHDFVIVKLPDGRTIVYAACDGRAQLEARLAFLVWDGTQSAAPSVGSDALS